MNAVLASFESASSLGPTRAALLLGVAYSTYAQYRSGRRKLPTYHRRHIQALALLPAERLRALIQEHVIGEAGQ